MIFSAPYIRFTKYGLRYYIYKCVSINQGINSRYSRIWYPISSMRWCCKHHIHRNADNISLLLPPLYFAFFTQKDCISCFILINLIKVTFYTEYIEDGSKYTNKVVLLLSIRLKYISFTFQFFYNFTQGNKVRNTKISI